MVSAGKSGCTCDLSFQVGVHGVGQGEGHVWCSNGSDAYTMVAELKGVLTML